MEKEFILVQLRKESHGESTSGGQVMRTYLKDCARKHHTWFSTNSPVDEIKAGEYHTLLFMVDGEIAYRASVLDVYSYPNEEPCPQFGDAPSEWIDEEARTWIKFHRILPEREIKVEQLRITSSGKPVTDVPILRRCLSYVTA